MIQILRGSPASVYAYCLATYHSRANAFWIDTPPNEPEARSSGFWAGIRHLLPQLRTQLGDSTLNAAIEQHRLAASLILPNGTPFLTPDELTQRVLLEARLNSHLNHNWFMQLPLVEEWASLLHEIVTKSQCAFIIPMAQRLDINTLVVIMTLYRMFPKTAPDLFISHSLETAAVQPDVNGILWDDLSSISFDAIVANFQTLENATVVEVFENEQLPVGKSPIRLALDPDLDSALDYHAYQLLSTKCRTLTAEEMNLVINAMRQAFQCFAFNVALDLGLALLKQCDNLSPEQPALVYGIIGVAAHNRQFGSTDGNQPFNDFLENYFQLALCMETNPTIRICYYYRLIVTVARRKKELERALQLANEALDELYTVNLPANETLLQEAWIRNIRAYIYARMRQSEKAIHDVERAFVLAEAMMASAGVRLREVAMTASVIADNRALLAEFLHDREAEEYWIQQGNKILEYSNTGARFIEIASLDFYFVKLRMDLTLQAAKRGLQDAYQHFDAWWQEVYLFYLSNLYYRLGDLQLTNESLEKLLSLYHRLQKTEKTASTKLLLAGISLRLGALEKVTLFLEQDPDFPMTPHTQAEILSIRALVSACQNEQQKAEIFINQAIDIAIESGERDTLLMVARRAGDICQKLQQMENAEQAYKQALQIATVTIEGSSTPVATEMVGVYLGLIECGASSNELFPLLITALSRALRENAEAWWELPRAMPIIQTRLQCSPLVIDQLELFQPILLAASQRVDCIAYLDTLRQALPNSLHQYIVTPELASN